MPIPIIAEIVPQNDGNFPTHVSTYGKGGWHDVMNIAERDLIPRERRQAGMAVFVVDVGMLYTLGVDLATWGEIPLVGINDAPLTGLSYVRTNGAWIDIAEFLDGGIYAP